MNKKYYIVIYKRIEVQNTVFFPLINKKYYSVIDCQILLYLWVNKCRQDIAGFVKFYTSLSEL